MFSDNQKVSGRQAFRLLTFDLLGISTLLVPSVLAEYAGCDGIFCIAIGLAAGLLYLKIIGIVVKDMDGDYFCYIEQKFGKIIGKIVELGYMVYFVSMAGYTAYLFSDVVLKSLLREESFLVVLLLLLLLTAYGLWGGIEGRARVYEILFWFLIIPFFLMLLSGLRDIRTDYWTPVFVSDKKGIFLGSYTVFHYLELISLVLFLGKYMKNKKTLLRAGKSSLILTGIIHAILYLLLLGIFGSAALSVMDFPAVTMMSMVQLTGGFLKRTDALMFGVWFFTLYALLNSTVYYGENALLQMLELEKKEKKEPGHENRAEKIAIFLVILAVFAIACLFYWRGEACVLYKNILWYIGTPFLVLIPVVLALAVVFSRKKPRRAAAMLLLLFLCIPLSGCNTAELEDKNFPIEMAVNDPRQFGLSWLNEGSGGNRVADYNHLKVILLSQDFLEDESAMEEFLGLLENKHDVPRNAYIVVTKDPDKILSLGEELDESVGTYLEEMFEDVTEIKKTAYPTLGMFYQEKENKAETLLIPYITEQEKKPVVDHYYAWKRGTPAGGVDNEAALLSFFTTNEMDSYTLSLKNGVYTRLFDAHNEISFQEADTRQIVADIYCSGEILYDEKVGQSRTAKLEKEISKYMNNLASQVLTDQQIDLTDSYKKLGAHNRIWYYEYKEYPDQYEAEMTILYRIHITWVNM